MAATISLERYIAAFEAYARVTEMAEAGVREIAGCAAYLRKHFRGEVEIETLCRAGTQWYRSRNHYPPDVGKSCLMGRMIYGGEDLRTRPCPIHGGHWSGWELEACPAGCNYGMNLTGWLPNDLVDEWPARPRDPQLDQLADALRESWSAEHAAVYADRLIALGDPRGELITLELAMRGGATAEQTARHAELIAACFGDIRSTAIDELRSTRGMGDRARVELGFLDADIETPADVRKIYNSRNGRYLRRASIRGDVSGVVRSLAMLGIRPFKWLDELVIRLHRTRNPDVFEADAVMDSIPNLTTLRVSGEKVLSIEDLRRVATLEVSHFDSVRFLEAPLLEVVELSATEAVDPPELAHFLDSVARRAPSIREVRVPGSALTKYVEFSHPLVKIY